MTIWEEFTSQKCMKRRLFVAFESGMREISHFTIYSVVVSKRISKGNAGITGKTVICELTMV